MVAPGRSISPPHREAHSKPWRAGRRRTKHHRRRAGGRGNHDGRRRAGIDGRRRDEHRRWAMPAGRVPVNHDRRGGCVDPDRRGRLNHHHRGRRCDHCFSGVDHARFRRTCDSGSRHRAGHETAQGPPTGVSATVVVPMSMSRTGLDGGRTRHNHRRHHCQDSCFHVPQFRSAC